MHDLTLGSKFFVLWIESESDLSLSQLMVCHPCPSHFDRSLCSLDHQKIHPQWKNANLMYQHHVGGIYLSNICLYCTDLYLYLKCSHITRGYYWTYLFLKYFSPTQAKNYIYSHITRGYYWTYLYFYLISRCPPPWLVPTSPCKLCIDNGDHDGQWWGWELGIRFKVFCQISLPLVMVISMERFRNDLTIFVRSIYQW